MTNEIMTIQQFGAQVKSKYPQYSQYADEDIGQRMIQKYPIYQNRVTGFKPEAPVTPAISAAKKLDIESAQRTGAFVPASTERPTVIGEGAKVIANILPSAFGFAKGAVQALNPIEIAKTGIEAAKGFGAARQDIASARKLAERTADTTNKLITTYWENKKSGKDVSHLEGYFQRNAIDPTQLATPTPIEGAGKMFARALPGATAETAASLVPEAGREAFKAAAGGVKYAFAGEDVEKQTEAMVQVGESLQAAQRALVNDPVGSILPFILAARGAAGAGETAINRAKMARFVENIGKPGTEIIPKTTTPITTAIDTAISRTAAPVIKGATAISQGVTGTVGKGARFATGQATGLQPETISQIIETPGSFTNQARARIDRSSLGREVQSSLAQKASTLEETGAAYNPIRKSGVSVKVSPNWIDSTIKDLTGLNIKKGKVSTTGAAVLRDAADVRAIQHIYDLWKPAFRRGNMTANEFLNFRTDLANLSKFERQIGKSQPIESMTKLTRQRFNESYRPQLKGLEILDKEFATQTGELSKLSKGMIDKNGNLTDAAINRIANATGKGRDALLSRLEETVPGITEKIKILKAIEDIQNASGIKVGTYGRAAITAGIGISSGIIPGLITAVLTSPEIAVPILRQYGMLKNATAVRAVVNALRAGGQGINQLPSSMPTTLGRDLPQVKELQKTNFGRR